GRTRDARGGRHLCRHPPEGRTDRRMGEPAVASLGKPARVREGGRALCREIRARRRPAPAALVRLPHRAYLHRVLARPPIPPARPRRVPACGVGSAVAQGTDVSLMVTTTQTNHPRRTLLLTGPSRGIGHAPAT